jgi:hypothetical protein
MADLFPPRPPTADSSREHREYVAATARLDLYREIRHELWVLLQYIEARVSVLGTGVPPGQRPAADRRAALMLPWERERTAARRLIAGLGRVYD